MSKESNIKEPNNKEPNIKESNINESNCKELKAIYRVPGSISGLDQFNNKHYNKGLAFTREERQVLGIRGLLPYAVHDQDQQIKEYMIVFNSQVTDVSRFIFLRIIAQSNQRLFFKMVRDNLKELFPYIDAGTINLICLQHPYLQMIGPQGMYITIKDKGHIIDILNNWPETHIKVINCTNAEKCSGYGDLGAQGMPIAVTKVESFTVLGGIEPDSIIPIVLDVGTNSSYLNKDCYVGLRERRCSNEDFEEFMDEFMFSIKERFGKNCIVNFENFTFDQSVYFLDKYRLKYCMFDNDLQASGAAILAGLLASIRLTNIPLKDHKILFFGAGKLAIGAARLITLEMEKEGLEIEEARQCIFMFDSHGLVCRNRKKGELNESKLLYAHCLNPVETLLEAVEYIKPSILIGVSGQSNPGSFTKQVIQRLSEFNKLPIVYALSDPANFCEITAKQAICWSKGNMLYVGGTPSSSLEHEGRIYSFSTCNDAYIYPGLILGVLCCGCLHISDDLFLVAAEKVAKLVRMDQLQYGLLYPSLDQLPLIALAIAESVVHFSYRNSIATEFPKPKDKIEFIKSKQYSFEYPSAIPNFYKE